MIRTLFICFNCILFFTGLQAGVDVTLKFHYNNYPLCNWEVRLEHNNSPLGSAVTDLNGMVTFENVSLFAKEVDAFLYKLPKDDPGKWNAHGFIRLNDDYTGELDFGPIVADKGSPKSALEKAWNITLYECENLTPADLHTLPAKEDNVEKERKHIAEAIEPTGEVSFGIEEMVQRNHPHRIETLNLEIDIIDEKRQALNDAGKPTGMWKNKIYAAMLRELEAQREWADVKLRIVNTQAHGESTVGMMGEENAFQDRYISARDERQKLQHEARTAFVEERDETGNSALFSRELDEFLTNIALKRLALRNEKESKTPDVKRMTVLTGEIEKLQRKIDDLIE